MKKLEGLKTLDKKTFDWLNNQETLKLKMPGRPPLEGRERSRFLHIREVAKKEISDLTELLKVLPEQQQKQIFNKKNLEPFFTTLFNATSQDLSEEKRLRLVEICQCALNEIGFQCNADRLAPKSSQLIEMSGTHEYFPQIKEIRAILLEAHGL